MPAAPSAALRASCAPISTFAQLLHAGGESHLVALQRSQQWFRPCPEPQLSRQLTAVARLTRSRCQQLRLGQRAPTGHNWRGVHLQRGSGVRTGQKIFYGSLWVHTSDVPTLFHDWGQSRCKETALSAPNEPYWAQCSQGSGWSGGTSSPLEPQMVVPSTPVPGATADTR